MAKTVPLDGRTLAWARERFAQYYSATPVAPPVRFARREFAAFPFATETMMRRHAAFATADEFRQFLRREVPRHVYYSSAYYRYPDHPTMPGKEWLGADVIFDLDADHLRGAESLDYPGQLALVKRRVRDLLDDFLFGDFGIDPAKTALVFSGGRGYHVHVYDEAFAPMTSPERRELVDYIMGVGFDPRSVISADRGPSSAALVEEGERSRTTRSFHRLPPADAPGWDGRTTRAVVAMLERFDAVRAEGAAQELERAGLSKAKAKRLAKLLVTEGIGRKVRETLSLEVQERDLPPEFLEAVVARAALEVQGETDAPVTTDIHRLIRLPDSLHGGTGFRVTPLTPETLDAFDPFATALPSASGSSPTLVRLVEPVDYRFDGTSVAGAPGRELELPAPVALFLVLRGEAELPSSPG